MNLFETVNAAISTKDAAEMYGISVNRHGMACCPFHNDRNPSMKIDQRFHCFGCGADGDAINFTSRLFNLSPKDAAQKLLHDFGLTFDAEKEIKVTPYVRQKSEAQKYKEKEDYFFNTLSDYLHLLRNWKTDYAPQTPDDEMHPRFAEALQTIPRLEYLLDMFIYGSIEDRRTWMAAHAMDITTLEKRNKRIAAQQINKEQLQVLTAKIEAGIKDLFQDDKYCSYLSVMSRFHRYSFNNIMLIYMQNPDATLVASYNKWQDRFERHVKRGEHGIAIITPTPFKKKITEQKLDPDTKAPMLDKDGNVITEEKEIEIPMFRPVKVFDVSQTDGPPLPQWAVPPTGYAQNYEVFMEALRRSSPVLVALSEVQTVSAMVHEIAYSKLQTLESTIATKKDRNTEALETESVAYAICQYYGIQARENSFGYISSWSKDKELPELRSSLETINKTVGELIPDIDHNYRKICKERGIDLTAPPSHRKDKETKSSVLDQLREVPNQERKKAPHKKSAEMEI